MATKKPSKEVQALKARIAELEAQVSANSPAEPDAKAPWEKKLKAICKNNPEAVETVLRNGYGLPDGFTRATAYAHAHNRALAVGPEKMVEDIETFITPFVPETETATA